MHLVVLIAGFGALGCVTRYLLSGWVYGLLGRGFPYGTFAVNIVGAFIIGLIMEIGMRSTVLPAKLPTGPPSALSTGSPPFPPSDMKHFPSSKRRNFLLHRQTSWQASLPVLSSARLA